MDWTHLHPGEFVIPRDAMDRFGAAELLVALSKSDQKKAIVSAALARSRTQAISEKFQSQVEDYWHDANIEALEYLSIVLKNNPKTPVAKILARPDVDSALTYPFNEAADKSEAMLRQAWQDSIDDAVKTARGDFKLIGAGWEGYETDEGLLDELVGDLHANAKAMRSRYHEALNSDDPKKALDTVHRDSTARASFSVSTAVWSVLTQVRDSAIRLAGINKLWIARMDSRTCSHCWYLHGTVVGPGEEFPKGSLKTYRDKPLLGPPRHPRCRCVVVPTKLPKTKPKS
jgi:hypothetical protein